MLQSELEEDILIIKKLLNEAKQTRERIWPSKRKFLGYDNQFYKSWRDCPGSFYVCDAVSLIEAAKQMAALFYSSNASAKRYDCWVAESDSLDASQGLSGGYKFSFNRQLEEI